MAKTSASFTIMDYTDGVSLITGIDSNLPLTSLYDPSNQKLNPSWATNQLTLTPKVMVAGDSTDQVKNMTDRKWYRRINIEENWTEVVSGSNGETINSTSGILTVNQDKLKDSNNQVQYKFTGSYFDTVLKLTFPVEIIVTFVRVSNGTSFVICRAYAENGNQFKNEEPSELTVKAELIRGTSSDTSDVSYKWQSYDTSSKKWMDCTTEGYNTAVFKVTPSMVTSFAMYRCIITDTDANSNTANQSFTSEGIAFYDVTDPYQAVILSTAGSYFKNGVGSTILYCQVYQNGKEIDKTGTDLTYTWSQTDEKGDTVSSFSPTAVEYGDIVTTKKKAIKISDTDVTVKATFFCEVS